MREIIENETWQDTLYAKVLREEYDGLGRRFKAEYPQGDKESKKTFKSDIQGLLNALYDQDGADWLGRGEVQSIHLSATIAAYESFISDNLNDSPPEKSLAEAFSAALEELSNKSGGHK
ncbi:hypothetical protein FACS1894102_0720 [Spirochaetia bacterium]|nr:hypothetical protein FACS1894102_0720 [Spirochaetia bacterium]